MKLNPFRSTLISWIALIGMLDSVLLSIAPVFAEDQKAPTPPYIIRNYRADQNSPRQTRKAFSRTMGPEGVWLLRAVKADGTCCEVIKIDPRDSTNGYIVDQTRVPGFVRQTEEDYIKQNQHHASGAQLFEVITRDGRRFVYEQGNYRDLPAEGFIFKERKVEFTDTNGKKHVLNKSEIAGNRPIHQRSSRIGNQRRQAGAVQASARRETPEDQPRGQPQSQSAGARQQAGQEPQGQRPQDNPAAGSPVVDEEDIEPGVLPAGPGNSSPVVELKNETKEVRDKYLGPCKGKQTFEKEGATFEVQVDPNTGERFYYIPGGPAPDGKYYVQRVNCNKETIEFVDTPVEVVEEEQTNNIPACAKPPSWPLSDQNWNSLSPAEQAGYLACEAKPGERDLFSLNCLDNVACNVTRSMISFFTGTMSLGLVQKYGDWWGVDPENVDRLRKQGQDYFGSFTENKGAAACLNPLEPSCLENLATGLIDGLWQMAVGLKDLVVIGLEKGFKTAQKFWDLKTWQFKRLWYGEEAAGSFEEAFANSTQILSTRFYDSAHKEWDNLKQLGLKNWAKSTLFKLSEAMLEITKQSFACKKRKWQWHNPETGELVSENTPNAEKSYDCVETYPGAWDCATCDQKFNLLCGMGGFVIANILPIVLSGGVLGAHKGLQAVSSAQKALDLAMDAGNLARIAEARAALSAAQASAKASMFYKPMRAVHKAFGESQRFGKFKSAAQKVFGALKNPKAALVAENAGRLKNAAYSLTKGLLIVGNLEVVVPIKVARWVGRTRLFNLGWRATKGVVNTAFSPIIAPGNIAFETGLTGSLRQGFRSGLWSTFVEPWGMNKVARAARAADRLKWAQEAAEGAYQPSLRGNVTNGMRNMFGLGGKNRAQHAADRALITAYEKYAKVNGDLWFNSDLNKNVLRWVDKDGKPIVGRGSFFIDDAKNGVSVRIQSEAGPIDFGNPNFEPELDLAGISRHSGVNTKILRNEAVQQQLQALDEIPIRIHDEQTGEVYTVTLKKPSVTEKGHLKAERVYKDGELVDYPDGFVFKTESMELVDPSLNQRLIKIAERDFASRQLNEFLSIETPAQSRLLDERILNYISSHSDDNISLINSEHWRELELDFFDANGTTLASKTKLKNFEIVQDASGQKAVVAEMQTGEKFKVAGQGSPDGIPEVDLTKTRYAQDEPSVTPQATPAIERTPTRNPSNSAVTNVDSKVLEAESILEKARTDLAADSERLQQVGEASDIRHRVLEERFIRAVETLALRKLGYQGDIPIPTLREIRLHFERNSNYSAVVSARELQNEQVVLKDGTKVAFRTRRETKQVANAQGKLLVQEIRQGQRGRFREIEIDDIDFSSSERITSGERSRRDSAAQAERETRPAEPQQTQASNLTDQPEANSTPERVGESAEEIANNRSLSNSSGETSSRSSTTANAARAAEATPEATLPATSSARTVKSNSGTVNVADAYKDRIAALEKRIRELEQKIANSRLADTKAANELVWRQSIEEEIARLLGIQEELKVPSPRSALGRIRNGSPIENTIARRLNNTEIALNDGSRAQIVSRNESVLQTGSRTEHVVNSDGQVYVRQGENYKYVDENQIDYARSADLNQRGNAQASVSDSQAASNTAARSPAASATSSAGKSKVKATPIKGSTKKASRRNKKAARRDRAPQNDRSQIGSYRIPENLNASGRVLPKMASEIQKKGFKPRSYNSPQLLRNHLKSVEGVSNSFIIGGDKNGFAFAGDVIGVTDDGYVILGNRFNPDSYFALKLDDIDHFTVASVRNGEFKIADERFYSGNLANERLEQLKKAIVEDGMRRRNRYKKRVESFIAENQNTFRVPDLVVGQPSPEARTAAKLMADEFTNLSPVYFKDKNGKEFFGWYKSYDPKTNQLILKDKAGNALEPVQFKDIDYKSVAPANELGTPLRRQQAQSKPVTLQKKNNSNNPKTNTKNTSASQVDPFGYPKSPQTLRQARAAYNKAKKDYDALSNNANKTAARLNLEKAWNELKSFEKSVRKKTSQHPALRRYKPKGDPRNTELFPTAESIDAQIQQLERVYKTRRTTNPNQLGLENLENEIEFNKQVLEKRFPEYTRSPQSQPPGKKKALNLRKSKTENQTPETTDTEPANTRQIASVFPEKQEIEALKEQELIIDLPWGNGTNQVRAKIGAVRTDSRTGDTLVQLINMKSTPQTVSMPGNEVTLPYKLIKDRIQLASDFRKQETKKFALPEPTPDETSVAQAISKPQSRRALYKTPIKKSGEILKRESQYYLNEYERFTERMEQQRQEAKQLERLLNRKKNEPQTPKEEIEAVNQDYLKQRQAISKTREARSDLAVQSQERAEDWLHYLTGNRRIDEKTRIIYYDQAGKRHDLKLTELTSDHGEQITIFGSPYVSHDWFVSGYDRYQGPKSQRLYPIQDGVNVIETRLANAHMRDEAVKLTFKDYSTRNGSYYVGGFRKNQETGEINVMLYEKNSVVKKVFSGDDRGDLLIVPVSQIKDVGIKF